MKKIALLFPGQGAQSIGMGRNLYDRFEIVKKTIKEAGEILGIDLAKMCFQGNIDELTLTYNAQPAILSFSVAAYRVFTELTGLTPVAGAGHSLGEISALTCAGALTFPEAVKLVRRRGELMQAAGDKNPGGMAAVFNAKKEIIEAVCREASSAGSQVMAANFNSSSQIVISGHKDALQKAADSLSKTGARVVPLKVSAAFHSSLMAEAAAAFAEELAAYSFSETRWPVIANLTATPYRSKEELVPSLGRQIVSPVQWLESMVVLKNYAPDYAVETGTNQILKRLMKDIIPELLVYSMELEQDLAEISKWKENSAGTASANEIPYRCLAAAVCTRNQNWDEEEYRQGVVEPYRKIEKMRDEVEAQGGTFTAGQIEEALAMLLSVFRTKRVSLEEQAEILEEILTETKTTERYARFLASIRSQGN